MSISKKDKSALSLAVISEIGADVEDRLLNLKAGLEAFELVKKFTRQFNQLMLETIEKEQHPEKLPAAIRNTLTVFINLVERESSLAQGKFTAHQEIINLIKSRLDATQQLYEKQSKEKS